MKVFISFLFLSLVGYGQNIAKLDESNGLKNYIFGTSPESYKALSIEIHEGDTKLFTCTSNTLQIASVEFEYVRVTFFKNKLYDLTLRSKNSTATKLLQSLIESYGKPVLVKGNYEWQGKKVLLVYQKFKGENDAVISFSSKEIAAQYKKSK